MTRALAVDKCNKAGDVYGKMLVLTFEDNEDDMMNRILSLINTREEIIQMSGLNNHLLNFKGLMIDVVQRVIIRKNQEIELTYTEFEIFKLLAKHHGIVFSKVDPSNASYVEMLALSAHLKQQGKIDSPAGGIVAMTMAKRVQEANARQGEIYDKSNFFSEMQNTLEDCLKNGLMDTYMRYIKEVGIYAAMTGRSA